MSRSTLLNLWFVLLICALLLHVFPEPFSPLITFPEGWTISITDQMNAAMFWFTGIFGPFFKAIGWLLEWPIIAAQGILRILPWSVTCFFFVGLAYIASGWRLALFALASMLYMLCIGLWSESMNSLALVLISVPMAITIGFSIGVLGFYSQRAKRIILPVLDLLQTIPAFAYLIPILILFGFGTTVGLVASVLFAFPPTVRNTLLGLKAVGSEIIEAGKISGANARQLFWKVRFPAAKSQILLGVNQTTMAAFSMVIIASIIGGTSDIGWEVLRTMRKAQFGESLLAGLVIALMAMLLDRITYQFATRDRAMPLDTTGANPWLVMLVGMALLWVVSLVVQPFAIWPQDFVVDPAPVMNTALEILSSIRV